MARDKYRPCDSQPLAGSGMHLTRRVITNNLKVHKLFIAAVVALFLLALLGLMFLATRKRTNPQQARPLHPALFMCQRQRFLV